MALRNYSYSGKGPIYIKERGVPGGFMPIGNCSALAFSAEENRIEQPDYTSEGGGLANSITRIAGVTAGITARYTPPGKLARALAGTITRVAGGTSVTGERHTAYKGALVPFDTQPDISDYANTLTVTMDPDGTPVEAVADVDYEVTRAGIVILEDGSIADDTEIEVAYDKSPQAIVEALTRSSVEYTLVFDGLNEAQSGKAVTVTAHRVKFSPAQGLGLISDEFGELTMSADILADNAITGTGISRYFKVAMAD